MTTILLVEDEAAIRRGLEDNLVYEGYEVVSVGDAEAAAERLREVRPDLIVLDVMLPGQSGYEFCRSLRRNGNRTPILMLTARGQEFDRVMGLDLGADDYVTKPFSILELMARIRALLRRTAPEDELPNELRIGDIEVDFRRFETTRGGESLSLSRKEYGLLRTLASRPGEVFSREELLDRVWGEDVFPTTRTVDNHVSMLRSKLEPAPAEPRLIVTVHGVGYKLMTGE